MIEYRLDDSGIFYINFSGKITAEDIRIYLKEFENIKNLPNDLLLLYDMQKSDMEFRITSYNVCYTKLLRIYPGQFFGQLQFMVPVTKS